MFADLPLFRAADPSTSVAGGKDVNLRRGSQAMQLLVEYDRHRLLGLTDEEAGTLSGLAALPKCCYWKRCSELRALGLIETTGATRESSAHSAMMVCRITQAGIEALK